MNHPSLADFPKAHPNLLEALRLGTTRCGYCDLEPLHAGVERSEPWKSKDSGFVLFKCHDLHNMNMICIYIIYIIYIYI